MSLPYRERRQLLDSLDLDGHWWRTGPVFDDGLALFKVVSQGLEGVVAKRLNEPYRPGERGWVKQKNPAYWRLDQKERSGGQRATEPIPPSRR